VVLLGVVTLLKSTTVLGLVKHDEGNRWAAPCG